MERATATHPAKAADVSFSSIETPPFEPPETQKRPYAADSAVGRPLAAPASPQSRRTVAFCHENAADNQPKNGRCIRCPGHAHRRLSFLFISSGPPMGSLRLSSASSLLRWSHGGFPKRRANQSLCGPRMGWQGSAHRGGRGSRPGAFAIVNTERHEIVYLSAVVSGRDRTGTGTPRM